MLAKIVGWRLSGFSVHSKVKVKTRKEAERLGKYMIRPLLSLERLSFSEKEGKVSYRYGNDAEEVWWKDYLEFIARVVSHISDKGQVTIRCFGLYANAHRGKVWKAEQGRSQLLVIEEVYIRIPQRGGQMMGIAFITDSFVVGRSINYLKLTFVAERPSERRLSGTLDSRRGFS